MNVAPPRPARLALALVVLLALLAAGPGARPAAHAQAALSLEVTAAFAGNYAPDRWLPLSIVLRNAGPAASALLVAQLPGAAARTTLPLDLPGAGESRVTLYVPMDRQARELLVSVELGGASVAVQTVSVRPREGERLLAVVSPQPLTLSLPRRQDLTELPFLDLALAPGDLPDQPAGLSSLSLLLLSGVPAATLSPAQLGALLAWVRNGGHLILGGGPGLATTLSGLPEQLRVAAAGAPTRLDPAPLAAYAGAPAPAQLEGVGLTAPDALIFGAAAAPLWAQREVGLGRVTQLAFDPGLRAIAEWPGAPALWDRLLRPVAIYAGAFASDTSPDLLRQEILSSALGNLPAVNLPESGLLFALLAIYTILIGPGLALLLRQSDRQSLGWVVLPAAALAAFAIAGGIALSQRADQRLISQISLIEQVDADTARARTALGIVSPRAESFALSLSPRALVRQIQPGVSQYGPVSGVTGDLAQGRGDLEVAVDSWAIQGLLAEELLAFKAPEAAIVLGEQAIEAVVRNTSGVQLRDVAVAYGTQVVQLGTIEPGEEARAAWPPPPAPDAAGANATTPLSVLVLGDELEAGRGAGGQLDRRLLIREALINAAVGRGSFGEDSSPVVLAWLPASPLALEVAADGAARQQISLLIGRPRLTGAGAAFIPPGWMRVQPAAGQFACSGPPGLGLQATTTPLTMSLALPPDLARFQVSQLTLDLQSERQWPNAGVRTEIYNWPEQRWEELEFDGPGTLAILRAEPYLARGQLSLRLGGRISEAGCVFASARMSGALPPE